MQLWIAILVSCAAHAVYVEAINNRGQKAGWHWQCIGGKSARNVHQPSALAVISPADVFSFLDKLRSNIAFHRQLSRVPLYIVTDYSGSPIISHYPSGSASSKPTPTSVVTTKGPSKTRPEPYKIVEEFIKMFNGSKGDTRSQSTTHDINQMGRHLPNVMLYFMDPNACAAQIQELRRQGKKAHINVVTLNDYIQQLGNVKRDFDPILLPLADGLTQATNNGREVFKGTPIFTTDPPIVKTTPDNISGDFDPSTDKLVVFLSPDQALSLYRKLWWNKSTVIETNWHKEYYKLLPSAKPWSPQIRSASLEDLCRRTHTDEPYWGVLLHIMPPNVHIDKETENMLKEHKTSQISVMSLFYSLRSLFR